MVKRSPQEGKTLGEEYPRMTDYCGQGHQEEVGYELW